MANSNDNDDDDESLFDEESDSSTCANPETKRRRTHDSIPAAEINQNETKEESNNNETTTASSQKEESLHSLISNKQWNGVLERVHQLRAQYKEGERIPELHETEPTPLGAALTPEHAAPRFVIEAILDAMSHSSNIIFRILQYQPSLILKEDEMQMNVLHVILQKQPTLELVQLLVTTWARESNNNMEDAWTQLLSAYDGHGVLPIHYAIEHHADTTVILLILEKFPQSARMCLRTDRDISTVHHAVYHECSYPVLKALLQHYGPLKLGNAGNVRHKKDTPLHLLFHPEVQHVWQQTTTTTNMSRYKVAWYLIQQYSTTLKSDFGVKKGNKAEQAHKLVFGIKGATGQSVYQMAAALAEQHPTWEQLALLLRDFDHIIHQYSREWPHVDFASHELEE